MKLNFLMSAAAGAVMAMCGAALADGHAQNWDMPMAYADGNFHSQNGKLFAEAVGICTGGALNITVHAGGSLFGGGDIKRAVQTGQAPIGERLLSAHANENALFGIDSVPFLAASYEDSEKLRAASEEKMTALLADQNLVLLYSVPWPPQGLYFKKPVNGVADMEGVKFRSYNAATGRFAELAGMLPVQVEAAELTQALATGVAEAFVSSGSTGYDRKVWEQLTHFYDTQAWLPRNYVFVNKDVFEGADEQVQNCLKSSALLAQAAGTAKSQQLADWYVSQLAANGMTVAEAGEQLQADLAKIGTTLAAEWSEAAGADGAAIVDAFKAQ